MEYLESWRRHVERARVAGRRGDLLLLADEAPTEALGVEARRVVAELVAEWSAHEARPPQVLLFSGHMVDAPDRPMPRFPSSKVSMAARAIDRALDSLAAGPGDLALTQGACGGDILFTEACLRRAVEVRWLLPFIEREFIEASVRVGGDDWVRRYQEAKAALAEPPRAAPEALGPPPPGRGEAYPYERCNLWLLHSALSLGGDQTSLVCLWDGGGGDGPGGTAHMVKEVERHGGRIIRIDPRTL